MSACEKILTEVCPILRNETITIEIIVLLVYCKICSWVISKRVDIIKY